MPINRDNQLKFADGSTTDPLTILSAGVEELEYGNKYVVHIKPTIEGFDHFCPADGLKKKMINENVDVGDQINIEKIAPDDKYQYGYFKVNVIKKASTGGQIEKPSLSTKPEKLHKSDEKFLEQFPNNKLDLHELEVRIDKLEKMVTVLSSEAGHKPGDEKLPF